MKNEQVEQLIKIALAVHQVPDENQEPTTLNPTGSIGT